MKAYKPADRQLATKREVILGDAHHKAAVQAKYVLCQ